MTDSVFAIPLIPTGRGMPLRHDWDRLLGKARGGDRGALGALLEATRDDLQRTTGTLLGRRTRRQFALEDLLNEALLAVVREIRSLRATHYRGFRQWFATIARNHLCRRLRREEQDPRAGLEEDDVLCEDTPAFWSGEELDHLRLSLLLLPASQRIALVLREGLALRWSTIGFVLERELDATRLVHYRAVAQVRSAAHFRRERAARGIVQHCERPVDEGLPTALDDGVEARR